MIYKLNGQRFDITAEHLIGDVNYPGNWFQDKSNRDAMGITEEADPPTPQPTQAEIILQQISALEASVTPRMLREAILGKSTINTDGKTAKQAMTNIDAQIEALRKIM